MHLQTLSNYRILKSGYLYIFFSPDLKVCLYVDLYRILKFSYMWIFFFFFVYQILRSGDYVLNYLFTIFRNSIIYQIFFTES